MSSERKFGSQENIRMCDLLADVDKELSRLKAIEEAAIPVCYWLNREGLKISIENDLGLNIQQEIAALTAALSKASGE